jgi:hypothetical protein
VRGIMVDLRLSREHGCERRPLDDFLSVHDGDRLLA